MNVAYYILGISLGVVIGLLIKTLLSPKTVGAIKAVYDEAEGNKPYLYLEFDQSLDDLYKRKRIVLRVELPHK